MSFRTRAMLVGLILLRVASVAAPAQAPNSSPTDYVIINLQVQVNRPADQVWKRVGDYCAIADWLKVSCHYATGSGDVGTVRVINDTTLEPMVAKSAWSYTYTQTAGSMATTTYHGTVSIEPNGAGKSTIKYLLMYNQAALASDEVRASEHTRISTRFQGALDAMKVIAESKP